LIIINNIFFIVRQVLL